MADLSALGIDAEDPDALAGFWAGLLGRRCSDDGGPVLAPGDDGGFPIRFRPAREPRPGRNQTHPDLTSESAADQRATVERALDLGARHLDVGQGPDAPHTVLADPEGNEFCVLEPDNDFLAGCGFLGALAGDGTRAVGLFWAAALDWPLVWDSGQETAVRSPRGGPKITWGGAPLDPRTGLSRLRLELAAGAGLSAELDRLVRLGASLPAGAGGGPGAVELTDPDGREFTLWPPA